MHIEPLPVGFGAEVHDLDVKQSIGADVIATLVDAYARHHLLLFRDCRGLTPERQVEVCSWFGPLPEPEKRSNSTAKAHWGLVDNQLASGRDMIPFHCDISFAPHSYQGLSLYPLELPVAPTSTLFVSAALGWKALPEDLRALVEGRTARHFYDGGEDIGVDWPPFEQWHPIRRPHKVTGQPLLYVTEADTDRIEGMSLEESRATLNQLFVALYDEGRRYEHVWQLGDLMIWDNSAIQHSRPEEARMESGARIFQRVELGEMTLSAQITKARAVLARVA